MPNIGILAQAVLKDLFLVGNIKNNLVKYFMQHIRNDLIIDLINS